MGSLLAFFLLAYALAWACWIAAAPLPRSPLRALLYLLGVFSPALVALALTARAQGRAGVRALFRKLVEWRVDARWYVFAVSYIAAIKLVAALIHRVGAGAWPRFGEESWYIMLAAVVVSTPVQSGEEIGWRGYALPRLGERLGYAGASLVLGLIWALWHLPFFFFFPEADKYGQSLFIYTLQVTALSVAMTWLYTHTRGSLLLVMLMHAAVNNTKDIVPSAVPGATNSFALSASPVAWITVTLLWLCAGYFLLRMPKAQSLTADETSSGPRSSAPVA